MKALAPCCIARHVASFLCHSFQKALFLSSAAIALVTLAACGGGGGGGGGGGSGNQVPSAVFSAIPTSGDAPLIVDVDASGSFDPDGSIASYAWDFGDGGTRDGVTSSYTYTNNGSYTITLTVTDNAGATGTATTIITVGPSSGSSKTIDQQALEQYGHTMSSANNSLVFQAGQVMVMGSVESSNHIMFMVAGHTTPQGKMTSGNYALQGGFYLNAQ